MSRFNRNKPRPHLTRRTSRRVTRRARSPDCRAVPARARPGVRNARIAGRARDGFIPTRLLRSLAYPLIQIPFDYLAIVDPVPVLTFLSFHYRTVPRTQLPRLRLGMLISTIPTIPYTLIASSPRYRLSSSSISSSCLVRVLNPILVPSNLASSAQPGSSR